MNLDIYKIDGKPSGKKVKLDDEIFGIQPNDHAIYLSVKDSLQIRGRELTKQKRDQKYAAEVKDPGDKREEELREQVRFVHHSGLAVELYSDLAQEITGRNFLRKLNSWLVNRH